MAYRPRLYPMIAAAARAARAEWRSMIAPLRPRRTDPASEAAEQQVAARLRLAAVFGISVLIALVLGVAPASAQEITVDLGDGNTLTGRAVQLFLLVTVLSLAPGIAVMVTCFPFMVTVLSILRQAIGLQAAPPNMLIVSLALFLTYFVMEPTFTQAWVDGIQPLIAGELQPEQAFGPISEPFRTFMTARVDPETVQELLAVAPARAPGPGEATPLSVLVPAFMLSEIQRAFEIGFMIFLPFLVIDLAVASILMAMGMMMVPPVVVSLPFKLAFFVMADGWTLLAGALVTGYAG
ncbi:MAG: flagellar type III secretion system pore protein FliP [Pseudomonadota bacterium]